MPGSDGRIRVLRVIARLNMGGPALHVAYLTHGLEERGYDTTLVAGTLARGEDSMAFVAEGLGVPVVTIPELGREISPVRDLLATLQRRELEDAAAKLSADTHLAYQPAAEGERVAGVYRERVTLASGRFAMIDDGLGFQLVPWRPALEKELGREVRGVLAAGGRVEWDLGRKRGLGL